MSNFTKFVEQSVLLGLFIAVVGSAYIFIVTIIFHETSFAYIFNTWHFPMLLAIFIDIAFYKHLSALRT